MNMQANFAETISDAASARTWVTFRMWGKDLDPDQVSSGLHLEPSYSHKKGQERNNRSTQMWLHGHWDYTSKDRIPSSSLTEHIMWLLDQLEPVRSEIKYLKRQANATADIFCFVEATSNTGISLPHRLLRRVVFMGLDLEMDIYSVE